MCFLDGYHTKLFTIWYENNPEVSWCSALKGRFLCTWFTTGRHLPGTPIFSLKRIASRSLWRTATWMRHVFPWSDSKLMIWRRRGDEQVLLKVTYLHFSYLYSSYPSFRLHEGFLQAQCCKNQVLNPKILSEFLRNHVFFFANSFHVTSRVIHLRQQLPGFANMTPQDSSKTIPNYLQKIASLKVGSFSWGKTLGRCWKWFLF